MEESAQALHRYRLWAIVPKEPGKPGPPRRRILQAFDDLSDADLKVARRLHERKLGPKHLVEIDGVVVRRGDEVSQEEIDNSEPLPGPGSGSFGVNEYAHRILWDIYARDAEASEDLRKQTHELNQRALENSSKLDKMLDEMHAKRLEFLKQMNAGDSFAAVKNFNLEDLRSVVEMGVNAMLKVKSQGK